MIFLVLNVASIQLAYTTSKKQKDNMKSMQSHFQVVQEIIDIDPRSFIVLERDANSDDEN